MSWTTLAKLATAVSVSSQFDPDHIRAGSVSSSFFFSLPLYMAYCPSFTGGVAYLAHIGGMLFGAALRRSPMRHGLAFGHDGWRMLSPLVLAFTNELNTLCGKTKGAIAQS
jgi:hypothetical protein